jgi:hypothetical protein
MEMKLIVRFDYGITIPWVQRKDGLTTTIAGPDALVLRSDVKTRGKGLPLVGNLPQAFTHLGLINSARNLSQPHGACHHRSKQ